MVTLNAEERIAILEDVLEAMDEFARKLRSLGDPRIEAYCLAAFEGKAGGWLGHFERDILEEALDTLRSGEGDDDGDD